MPIRSSISTTCTRPSSVSFPLSGRQRTTTFTHSLGGIAYLSGVPLVCRAGASSLGRQRGQLTKRSETKSPQIGNKINGQPSRTQTLERCWRQRGAAVHTLAVIHGS